MAISGDEIKEANFTDLETHKIIKVSMPLKDIILLKLLESISSGIRRIHG